MRRLISTPAATAELYKSVFLFVWLCSTPCFHVMGYVLQCQWRSNTKIPKRGVTTTSKYQWRSLHKVVFNSGFNCRFHATGASSVCTGQEALWSFQSASLHNTGRNLSPRVLHVQTQASILTNQQQRQSRGHAEQTNKRTPCVFQGVHHAYCRVSVVHGSPARLRDTLPLHQTLTAEMEFSYHRPQSVS